MCRQFLAAKPFYCFSSVQNWFHCAVVDITWDEINFNAHYENMSVQYTAIFHGCKNDNFQLEKCDHFLIFALKHRLWVLVRTASLRRF